MDLLPRVHSLNWYYISKKKKNLSLANYFCPTAIVIIAFFLFITCALFKNLTYFWHAFYKWKENSS